jgi:hypothetical protein
MPINIPSAPAQSIAALRAAVPEIANQPGMVRVAPRLAQRMTSATAAASLTPELSYKVYTLGLSDLAAATNDLRAAKATMWRHTLTSNDEVVSIDVAMDASGANHKFAALSSHPAAGGVQKELQALNQDRHIASASYELSLLQIPALAVRAVWLQDASGKAADVLVPIAPVRSELVAGRRYAVAEFIGALRSAAARILADDDPRKGSA